MSKKAIAFIVIMMMAMQILPNAAACAPVKKTAVPSYTIALGLKAYKALEDSSLQKRYAQGKLADYPGKSSLIAQGDRLLPELNQMIASVNENYDYQRINFAIDLLGSLGTPASRQRILSLTGDSNACWMPSLAASIRQFADSGTIRTLMSSFFKTSNDTHFALANILTAIGGQAVPELTKGYRSLPAGDVRRGELIGILVSSEKGRGVLMQELSSVRDRQEKDQIIMDLAQQVADESWRPRAGDREAILKWLRDTAANNNDPSCQQEALAGLYNAGQKNALAALAKNTEENGVFRENGFWGWKLLYALNKQYPNSLISRGIAAYEKVRGMKYFVIDRPSTEGTWWGYVYGDKQYSPDTEIPGYEAFLKDYPGHPATDSASYRLGRCYEIKGRYTEALNMLLASSQSPDGDMKYDASQRVIFVADVVMNDTDVTAALSDSKLREDLKPLLQYTHAVKLMRKGAYDEAQVAYNAFIEAYDGQPVYKNVTGWDSEQWGFWNRVKTQRDLAAQLAVLKQTAQKSGQEGLDARYKMAALIYHDDKSFYNHFWQGGRITYLWIGHISETYDDPHEKAKIAPFLKEHNNFCQALPIFEGMLQEKEMTAAMREKVDYSVALCYEHLLNYGIEMTNLFPKDELRRKTVESFTQFIEKYPESEMSAKALLAVGLEKPDRQVLEALVKKYPKTKEASTAEAYLKDQWFWQYPR